MKEGNPSNPETRLGKLAQDLNKLTGKLLRLAELAEKALDESVRALWQRDAVKAREIIAGDKAINDLEEEIDIDCVAHDHADGPLRRWPWTCAG